MAGIHALCRMPHLVVAVTVAVTLMQVQNVGSQNCTDVEARECCRVTTQTCPNGFFEDNSCDVTASTTPSGIDETSTYDDANITITDHIFMAEDENTTESSNVETPTDPPITDPPGVNCKRCEDNCIRCNATSCLECQKGYTTGNGSCIKIDAQDQVTFPVGPVAGGVAGGVVLIVVIAVVIGCSCKRCKRSSTTTLDERLRERDFEDCRSRNDEELVPESESNNPGISQSIHRDYENLGFKPDDLATRIPRKQDDVLRYTRDPTSKLEKGEAPVNVDTEEIYENQDMMELERLPPAPAPPTSFQSRVIRKNKRTTRKEPEVVEMEDEPQETYYNEPTPEMRDALPLDGEAYEQEVYYNDPEPDNNEPESLYMNYNPPEK